MASRWLVFALLLACGRIGFRAEGDGAIADGVGGDAALVCSDSQCLSAGGTCTRGECVINVNAAGPLVCPAGLFCRYDCNTASACNMVVDCTASLGCIVACNVASSCTNTQFRCAPVGCSAECTTQNTCSAMTCMSGSCVAQCCA